MAEETIILRFAGPAVENGSMDAYAFAQSLMGFSKAIQIAATEVELTGPSAPSIKITDVKQGSFIAELALVADLGIFEHAAVALNGDAVNAALNLNDLINVALGAFVGLKKLQGRKIKKVESHPTNPGESQLTLNDNAQIIVQSGAVVNLIQNPTFISAADEATKPVAKEGVDTIQFKTDSVQTQEFELQKNEYVPFNESLPEIEPEQIGDDTKETYLQFVRPVLNSSSRKWGADDGDGVLEVKILDEHFLKLVEDGKVSFSGRPDLYKVLLRTTQEFKNNRLKKHHEVLKVMERKNPNGGMETLPGY